MYVVCIISVITVKNEANITMTMLKISKYLKVRVDKKSSTSITFIKDSG